MTAENDLKRMFRVAFPEIDWTYVESGGTGRGIPDTNGCFEGVEFWIEFKIVGGVQVSLRPEQCAWIGRRMRHGGRVFVAARRQRDAGPRKGAAADELWLFRGDPRDLRCVPWNKSVVYWGGGGPKEWGWASVKHHLTRV